MHSRLRDLGGKPLPVLSDGGALLGVIDAPTALEAVRSGRRGTPCAEVARPGHGLDVQADRADLERTVRRHGYAVVTDNGGLVGVVTDLDLLRDAERAPCEASR